MDTTNKSFTRADWRPGKRGRTRKRKKPWGGAKVANAGLLAASKATQFGQPRAPKMCCKVTKLGKPCGKVALKGLMVCAFHGGAKIKAARGEWRGSVEPKRKKQAPKGAMLADLELMQSRAYREASDYDRLRMIERRANERNDSTTEDAL